MICHQFKIRQEKEELEKDLFFLKEKAKLKNTLIKKISHSEAKAIICEYEWLKSMPSYIKYMFGIYFIIEEKEYLGGVVIYSEEYANNTKNWDKYGFNDKIILLSRGVSLWWTPKNTASFFITKTFEWLKNNTKYEIVTATVDPMAGEVGIIYQSLNFKYFGLMDGNIDNNGKEYKRLKIIINGKKYSTRTIRKIIGSIKKEDVLNRFPDAKFIYEFRKRRYFYFLKNKNQYIQKNEAFIKPYPKKTDILYITKNGIIYKITNKINNKLYIGQTYRNFKDRINEHKNDSKCKDYPLYKAIRKYGLENFEFEILEENVLICDLNEKEIYYINKFQSNNKLFGYNLDFGGRNKIISDETKNKMSEKRKGYKQSSDWVEKRKRYGTEHHSYGKKHSDEYKKSLSDKMKGENSFWYGKKRELDNMVKTKRDKYGKKVIQYNIETNEVINTFDSIGEAVKYTGKTFQTISNQCNGKVKKIIGDVGFKFL